MVRNHPSGSDSNCPHIAATGGQGLIHKRMNYKIIFAIMVLATAADAMAAAVIVEDRAVHAAQRAALGDRVASVHAMAGADDSTSLLKSLGIANRDQSMDPVLRDYLLETTILALSGTTPTTAARNAVSTYQNRKVSSFVRLDDEHGQAVVPLYDIAAAARMTMRVWETFDAKVRVTELLLARSWSPDSYLHSPTGLADAAWREGTRQAVESANVQLLLEQKAAVLKALIKSEQFDGLSLSMAVRLNDGDLFRAIFEQASTRIALDAINYVSNELTPAEAVEMLAGATAREEISSAAILALGKFASNDRAVRVWLLDRLGNAGDGGSAALALARIADQDILDDIASIIKNDMPELAKLRAALVLRLSNSDAARAVRVDLLTQQLSSERLRGALL